MTNKPRIRTRPVRTFNRRNGPGVAYVAYCTGRGDLTAPLPTRGRAMTEALTQCDSKT